MGESKGKRSYELARNRDGVTYDGEINKNRGERLSLVSGSRDITTLTSPVNVDVVTDLSVFSCEFR
jgi:hypothetical protein